MSSPEQGLQRQENLAAILAAVRSRDGVTRRDAAKICGLSWACISESVSGLVSQGVLSEEKSDGRKKGRTPCFLRLNPKKTFIGADVNTTGISVCLCNLQGEKGKTYRYPVNTGSEDALLQSVHHALNEVLSEQDECLGIGISMQGIYDPVSGRWHLPGRSGMLSVDIKEALQKRIGLLLLVEHDPDCCLFGFSDMSRSETRMMVRINNGIGVSLCRAGSFLIRNGLELGYTVVDPSGRRLHDIVSLKQAQIHRSDPSYFESAGQFLGVALGNTGNMIPVEQIVLCGGLMEYADRFWDSLTASYEKTVLPSLRAALTVSPSCDAAYGAAKLAAMRYPCY